MTLLSKPPRFRASSASSSLIRLLNWRISFACSLASKMRFDGATVVSIAETHRLVLLLKLDLLGHG